MSKFVGFRVGAEAERLLHKWAVGSGCSINEVARAMVYKQLKLTPPKIRPKVGPDRTIAIIDKETEFTESVIYGLAHMGKEAHEVKEKEKTNRDEKEKGFTDNVVDELFDAIKRGDTANHESEKDVKSNLDKSCKKWESTL